MWRYQPVWQDEGAERTYSIVEVFLDGDRLQSWTQNPTIAPDGDTWDELQRDLGRMYEDCWNWQPVALAEMRVGMTFHRREHPA
jgi:hypothetical protein